MKGINTAIRLAAALLSVGLLVSVGAQAQPAVVQVNGLEGLVPLDPLTLRNMRGGQLGRPPVTSPGAAPGIRLWDEIARPPRPPLPQDGAVTSMSRAAK